MIDNPGSRAGTPVDVHGRSQQVSGATLQVGGVSLCLRDEEAEAAQGVTPVGQDMSQCGCAIRCRIMPY